MNTGLASSFSVISHIALAAAISRKFLRSALVEELAVEDVAKVIETRTDLSASKLHFH